MARQGITYAEVAAAATELTGQGRHPTIEQIRLLLGSGSSTTIANHLKAWKKAQSGNTLLACKENLPQELIAVMKGLWERVIATADDKAQAVVVEHREELDKLQRELIKYKRNNQRWQQLFQQWAIEKTELDKEREQQTAAYQLLQDEHTLLAKKYELATQQLIEKQERIEELHQLQKQIQTNLEQFQERTTRERQHERNELAEFKKELQAENNDLKQQLSSQHEVITALRSEQFQLTHTVQQQQGTLATAQHQLAASKASQLETEQLNMELKLQHKQSQQQLEEQKSQCTDLHSRLTDSQAQAKFIQSQYENTQQELKKWREGAYRQQQIMVEQGAALEPAI